MENYSKTVNEIRKFNRFYFAEIDWDDQLKS